MNKKYFMYTLIVPDKKLLYEVQHSDKKKGRLKFPKKIIVWKYQLSEQNFGEENIQNNANIDKKNNYMHQ